MPDITLPDGKKINFEKSISGFEVAEKISKSLSKQALLISVDGELKDLNHSISKDSSIKIFTSKDKEGFAFHNCKQQVVVQYQETSQVILILGQKTSHHSHPDDLALRLLREGTEALTLKAERGQYEFPLEGRSVLLVRIEVNTAEELVAEISANKHLIAVRFRRLDEKFKLQAIDNDVEFNLSLCNF